MIKRSINKISLTLLTLLSCILLPTAGSAYVPSYITIASTPTHSPYIFQANEMMEPIDFDPNLNYEFTAFVNSFPNAPQAFIAVLDVTNNYLYSPMPITVGGPPYTLSTKPGPGNLNASNDHVLIIFNAVSPGYFTGFVNVYQYS